MKRLLFLAALACACSSSNNAVGSGQFVAPTGLAITSAQDRDLLFVAGTGRDGLRALQICTTGSTGNISASCSGNDLQFIPGPIRLFPANIETGDRPLRLAGARLSTPAGLNAGVVLVVGADKTVRMVDAQQVVDAPNATGLADGGVLLTTTSTPLDGVGADIVADNAYDATSDIPSNTDSMDVFVATLANGTTPAELVRFTLTYANGAATLAEQGKCALTPVVPTSVAVSPREAPLQFAGNAPPATTTDVFVGDGAGDGVVRISRGSIAGGACAMTRISASGHSVTSVALSPQWYEGASLVRQPDDAGTMLPVAHPAGELLLMVAAPLAAATPGTYLDPGGVLIADTCSQYTPADDGDGGVTQVCTASDGGAIVPIPPWRFDGTNIGQEGIPNPPPDAGDAGPSDADAGPVDAGFVAIPPPPPMEPINANGIPSQVAFAHATRPGTNNLLCTRGPCNFVYTGTPSDSPIQTFPLLGMVTSSDGSTYFIDVVRRRFVDANYFNIPFINTAQTPVATVLPVLSPATSVSPAPDVGFEVSDLTHPLSGWLQPGVTHNANWRVIWHSTLPGLPRTGGTLSESGHGTYYLDTPASFAPVVNDPVVHFGPGDAVSFAEYSQGTDGSAACKTLVTTENLEPLRFELPVLAIDAGGVKGRLEIGAGASAGFNPGDACTSLSVVAEFHAGGAQPWLVFENFNAMARIGTGELFASNDRRIDYPSDYSFLDAPGGGFYAAPRPATDTGLAFRVQGAEPLIPGTELTFTFASSLAPISYRDSVVTTGYATGIAGYVSNRFPNNLLFSAVTGSNSVVAAVPDILYSDSTGIQIYR